MRLLSSAVEERSENGPRPPASAFVFGAAAGFGLGNLAVIGLWRLGEAGPFALVGGIYLFNTRVLPVAFALLGAIALVLAPRRSDRRALQVRGVLLIAAAIAMFGTYVYATHIEPNRLVVHRIELRSAKIRAPLRILHISDLQASEIDAHEEEAIATMRALEPDLVIHTGDLLQPIPPATFESELPKLVALLEGFAPPLGFFHTEGDVDWRLRGLDRVGPIRLLENDALTIELPGARLRLLGLDLFTSSDEPRADRVVGDWFATTAPEDLTIVAGHRPDLVFATRAHAIDLSLAGHTHGGQIRVPFFGPPITLSRVPREWARGLHRAGRTTLHVSAGIGAEHAAGIPSIRLDCPPEMTLFELVPE